METPGLVISFFAGMASFLSPCVAPLIPAYLANISGVAIAGPGGKAEQHSARRLIMRNAIVFIVGFSIIFSLAGISLGYLSSLAIDHQTWLNRIGGAIIMILSLQMLGLIRIPLLESSFAPDLSGSRPTGPVRSALMGVSFGIGFSPCTGPVLGAILVFTATSGSMLHGALLMASFSAGLALPFLLVGLFATMTSRWLMMSPHTLGRIHIVSGLLMLGLGIVIFTGRVQGLIGLFTGLF